MYFIQQAIAIIIGGKYLQGCYLALSMIFLRSPNMQTIDYRTASDTSQEAAGQ